MTRNAPIPRRRPDRRDARTCTNLLGDRAITLFGTTTKEKIISVAILLLVLMVFGFQKSPPEVAARAQQRLHQSEQNLDEAKARLQRAWDNSPLNPMRK